MIGDRFAGDRIVSVTLRLGLQRPHHLGVAEIAALAHVDVATLELQRGVRLYAGSRRDHRALKIERDDLREAAGADHDGDQSAEQPGILLDDLMLHVDLSAIFRPRPGPALAPAPAPGPAEAPVSGPPARPAP